MRYLALGDSLTVGTGVEPAESWPAQLAQAVRECGCALDEPHIIATRGWTTHDLLAAVEREAPAGPFDLVSLLIGVNDQYDGYSLDDYRRGFGALLERAIRLAGGQPGRVVVVSVYDWGQAPFAADRDAAQIASEIDRFNQLSSEAAQQAGARYVDVTTPSRRFGADPAYYAADGLHPSGRMYAEWAQHVLPTALQALRGQP